MSCKININLLTDEQINKINKELEIKIEDNQYKSLYTKYIYPYEIIEEDVYIPFSYAHTILKLNRNKRENYPRNNVEFNGELRSHQKEIKRETIDILNKNGSVIISAYTGFGKTITGINLSCTIGLKTLIIVNKLVLMSQWEESIKKFCPNSIVQKISTNDLLNTDANFYIMNAINVPKVKRDYFNSIGMLIIDEAHLIMAETLSKCMQYIQPRYLIGLTATPYRPDGLNILLDFYFGINKIIRKLYRKHIVYYVDTKFKPKIEKTKQNRMNWNLILESQAMDPDRNELIINIVKKYKERIFLILVKRVEQGDYLLKKFQQEGEYATSLLGKKQNFDQNARILIGTVQKVGCGFDHSKLNTLLLATDVEEYFIQYLGRVFRTETGEPYIFDLVDDNHILKKHFLTRKNIYIEHGGIVKTYKH
jgi:superfamily II DNA or RNA helicase